MNRILVCTLLAWILTGTAAPAADGPEADLKALQGRWKLVSAEDGDGVFKKQGYSKHVVLVEGERWKVVDPPEEVEEATPFKLFSADAEGGGENRRRIDFETGSGKERLERIGIYALEGDKFTLCFSSVVPKDESRRPTAFVVRPARGEVLLVYERVLKE